ncbi:MAG: hypothetical protein H0W11_12000 [Gemmatimonadetes bacterium]|nr:hypothetical protein [Gemmatimonadota bacterium]
MVELRTLGALDLRAVGGRVLESVLAQPKRIALLVYLAAAAPGRLHRRDILLALFWPEADEARARNSLSQALHFLRRSLGEGVLVSRGEEIGLDRGSSGATWSPSSRRWLRGSSRRRSGCIEGSSSLAS